MGCSGKGPLYQNRIDTVGHKEIFEQTKIIDIFEEREGVLGHF